MQAGLLTDSLSQLSRDEVLDVAAELELDTVEFATGNWSESPHLDLKELLTSGPARRELADAVSSRDLEISALTANGNQLHPVSGTAHDQVVRDSIRVAGEMGIPTVVLMSGLPGAPGDSAPNWITTSWPPETLEILDYQWDDVAAPYWTELANFARKSGAKLAVEMHGHQLVYNVASLKRLQDIAGSDVVGANLDPSHLMWMGADIPAAIRALGDSIFHVHAKDVRIERRNADINGRLDTLPPAAFTDRSWNFITLGLGHEGGESFWGEVAYTLRAVGYDGTLSIEHEDILLASAEGVERSVRILQNVLPRGAGDWTPAKI